MQAQWPDHPVANKTITYQSLEQNHGNPFGILHVTFTPGQLLDELEVDETHPGVILEQVPNLLPVNAGTFHANLIHVIRLNVKDNDLISRMETPNFLSLFFTLFIHNTHEYAIFMDVKAAYCFHNGKFLI